MLNSAKRDAEIKAADQPGKQTCQMKQQSRFSQGHGPFIGCSSVSSAPVGWRRSPVSEALCLMRAGSCNTEAASLIRGFIRIIL
jgi:hypothetical protein